MDQKGLFALVRKQYADHLPFVVYSKPESSKLKAILQPNSELYKIKDYEESGFIFAPFEKKNGAVLIPLNGSKVVNSEFIPVKITSETQINSTYDEVDKQSHIALVKSGIKKINEGQIKKVVLSRFEKVALKSQDPIDLFQRLLTLYPSAFAYCWYHPKVGLWLGATPETLIQLKGKRFKTMSLAGTRSKGDKVISKWNAKEKEEQQLVTNFIESRLQDISKEIFMGATETISAGPLLHLQTKISGVLEADLKTVLSKIHPTPAVCGLPLEEARSFILENEQYSRAFYTGFLGELNFQVPNTRNRNPRNVENNAYNALITESNLYVNLRCMEINDLAVKIFVGGGITKDSIAENEWLETVAKAEVMKQVLTL